MRARWTAWTLGIALLAAVALFPLRVALDLTDISRIGLSARQVAGTIWYGRLGELHLGERRLGTFEVALSPAALLIGRASMRFHRIDGLDGPLDGRLVNGARRGVVGVTGRVAVGDMFAPLPIGGLELRDVTVLFRRGRCIEAGGEVVPIIAMPVAEASFGTGLRGILRCDGERARVTMTGSGGGERVEFYVHSSGAYRGWISVRGASPSAAVSLSLLGFKPTAQGMTLSVDGRL